jgi:hypothetical protein
VWLAVSNKAESFYSGFTKLYLRDTAEKQSAVSLSRL